MLTVTILHCVVMIFPIQVHVKRTLYNIDIQVYTASRLPHNYMEFHSVWCRYVSEVGIQYIF